MKKTIAMLTAMVTILASATILPATAEESIQETNTFVVLKKTETSLTVLNIDEDAYHRTYSWQDVVCADTYIFGHCYGSDTMVQALIADSEYGDIIEYSGPGLERTETTGMNCIHRMYVQSDVDSEEEVPMSDDDHFEKIGTVFETPQDTVGSKTVNGEELITVTVADGTVYTIGKDPALSTSAENIFYTAEEYRNMEYLPLRVLQSEAESTVFGDINGDGKVDASDAAVILEYAAANGAGNFTGTLEEYVKQ
jgi:hypothetical protein